MNMIPKCPKCGVIARYVKMRASVIFDLNDDGTPGTVVRAQRATEQTDVRYVCGGRHEWKAEPATDQDGSPVPDQHR